MENKNKFVLTFVLVATALLLATAVKADTVNGVADITSMNVYVSNTLVWQGSCDYNATANTSDCSGASAALPGFERGSSLPIDVVITAGNDAEKVKVKAWVTGYNKDIEAQTAQFDLFAGSSYTKSLDLEIPADIDALDTYTLHIAVEQKNDLSGVASAEISTTVQRATDLLEILSVNTYTANNKIEAGSNLYVDVVVRNRGNYAADDVQISASIKELGLTRTVYIGDLDTTDNDNPDSQSATLVLPLTDAKAGTYVLEVTAYNSKTSAAETKTIVVSGEQAQTTTSGVSVTAQTATNTIAQGKGAVYTLEIKNLGTTSQNFVVQTEGTEGWATVQLNPSSFTLAGGESTTVNVYVVADENAVAAEHIFSAKVNYGSNTKTATLTANVTGTGTSTGFTADLKTTLIIISIVLAVAIIILLIVLLSRKTKSNTEETYY